MLGQPRTTQRRARKVASDEGALRGDIVRLASRFGRYGYRRVTDMLRIEGWGVNHKRVERIWRQEGLKVPGAAAEARSAVAQRRIVHPAEAAVSGPRMVVRFRGLEDARRACAEAADSAGRAYEGVPGLHSPPKGEASRPGSTGPPGKWKDSAVRTACHAYDM